MRLTRLLSNVVCVNQPAKYISRTVLVENNEIEPAMRILNGIMSYEGFLKRYQLTRRYEKPYRARNRVNFEKCSAVYSEDMENKIKLLMRKNRINPYPGTD